jgi:hypothetical protein
VIRSFAHFVSFGVVLVVLAAGPGTSPVHAQKVAKYGADFLSGGVGGRALGMGGAYVGLANDVTAGYWNAAGLGAMQYPEVAYMHVERFAGIVSFDYGAVAFPINARSTFGLSFFRSGVNDIKNTLDAWDPERDQPKPNPENYFESFSAADYAFYLSYARLLNERFRLGVTGKIIRRGIGDFADAWGYSFDVGVQYQTDRFVFGVNVQDATTMLQSWSINQDELRNIQDVFGAEMPEGGTALVLPVVRLGSGVVLPAGESSLTFGFDVDLAFDGQQRYALNAGDVSFHPRLGTEFAYKGVVALRAGLDRISESPSGGLSFTPSVGAGLHIKQVAIDYGFGDFAGLTSDLGYSHRISAKLTLEQPRFERPGE